MMASTIFAQSYRIGLYRTFVKNCKKRSKIAFSMISIQNRRMFNCQFLRKFTLQKLISVKNCLNFPAVNQICKDQKIYLHNSVTCSNNTNQAKHNQTVEIPNFQSILDFRTKQAHNSIILEISSENQVSSVSEYLTQHFELKNRFHYVLPSGKNFILVELCSIEAVQNLLQKCKCSSATGEVQTFSRCIKYNDSLQSTGTIAKEQGIDPAGFSTDDSSKFDIQRKESLSPVDKAIEECFNSQQLNDESIRLRLFLCSQLSDFLHGIYSHCIIFPFGSSINGFGNKNADLDAILLPYGKNTDSNPELFFQTKHPLPADHEQKFLNAIGNILITFLPGISSVDYVYKANVPLIKFQHDTLGLKCDLSLSNITGLGLTELLFYCGHFDSRVKPLAFAVKKWAKEINLVCEQKTQNVSSFSLMLLLIFFLQTRPCPVLPPLHKFSEVKDLAEKEDLQYLKIDFSISNEESLGELLMEYFVFLKEFDFRKKGISTYQGKLVQKFENSPLFLENPLNRELNVARNLTRQSFAELRKASASAVDRMEFFMKSYNVNTSDFWKILLSTKIK